MTSKLLDFSKYEKADSKFLAELSSEGGYITFSNSGKGGDKKYFTLGLSSFLNCLIDIRSNHNRFIKNQNYVEKSWRDLGSEFFTDKPANAQITVQTKPLFTTLSKIIVWANSPKLDHIIVEEFIDLDIHNLDKAIDELKNLIKRFTPVPVRIKDGAITFSNKSIREFALQVFNYFYRDSWASLLSDCTIKQSKINDISFNSYDFNMFKRVFAEFDSSQTSESLTSSGTLRYFQDPIYQNGGKYFYFSTQWNGKGDYDLTFENLKSFFESNFDGYSLINVDDEYRLVSKHVEAVPFKINTFTNPLDDTGLIFEKRKICCFISSLQVKPFVILTGLTGSGKTKLAEAFSLWITNSSDQYCILAVGADWTNREPLLGFPNALESGKYVKPDSGVLDLILRAEQDQTKPYFLILDEMNMSHVERYFADFLSAMESVDGSISLHPKTDDWENCDVPSSVKLPPNLFIIGTVNVDETTYMFSPKVLDRANVIEFRVSSSEMETFFKSPQKPDLNSLRGLGASMAASFVEGAKLKGLNATELNKDLLPFFKQLQEVGAEFGYRTVAEISRFVAICNNHANGIMEPDEVIDAAIMQKLLPKIHGSRNKIEKVLTELAKLCLVDSTQKPFQDDLEIKYPLSYEKIERMHKRVISDGFTSFAEA